MSNQRGNEKTLAPTDPPDGLVGRAEDVRRVLGMLNQSQRTAAVMGAAGVGKSALLAVVSQASADDGWRVVTLRGRVAESRLGFVGLLDLLSASSAEDSPDAATAAQTVRERVIQTTTADLDPLRLRLDFRTWLDSLSADRPVLVVVDDAQWVDASSWSVLSFIAHRIAGSRVSVLFSWRAERSPEELRDHPGLVLQPLAPDAAQQLLELKHPHLDPEARLTVATLAVGNPLALLELARASTSSPLAGAEPSTFDAGSTSSSVPETVQRAFAAELPTLGGRTRQALLLAAAGAEDLVVLAGALGGRQLAQDLEPAERVGLVRTAPGRLEFRHPLVASAVYESATTAERVAAHELLASVYAHDEERRVWHLAAATLAPDEALAAELSRAAERARSRGAHAEAARAMLRAVELSPTRADRERRLLEALTLVSLTGRVDHVARLAERLRVATDDPLVRARAAQHHAYALAQTMSQSAAQDALELALEELEGLDPEGGWATLTTLTSLVYQTRRDVERAAVWLDRYEQTMDLPPPPFDRLVRASRAWSRAALDPMARPRDVVALVRETPPGDKVLPPDLVGVEEMLLGATAWLVNEHDVALRRLTKATTLMDAGGASGHLIQTLMALGQVQFDVGRYDAAASTAGRMVDLADAESLHYYGAVARELQARVAAVQGQTDWARRVATEVLLDLEVGECLALEANLRVTLAHERFAARDHAAGYQQLRALFDESGTPLHTHVAYRALGDLASAALRAGETDAARPVVELAEHFLRDLPGARHAMILCRAKALVSRTDPGPLFERAIRDPSAAQWPLEWANAHLDYGLWLRRQRRTSEARQRLRTAREIFQRIGATAWEGLADAELRAAGVAETSTAQSAWSGLTAQERQVVELAATGLTNREIGAALYLSPRTVGAHLYHAFPKLGVTVRAQLRDVVDGNTPPEAR